LRDSLAEHLEDNDEFRDDFEQWTASQSIEYEGANVSEQREVREEFAEQASYLLINKIIFYKLLEDSPTYRGEIEPLAVSPFRVQEDLQEYFDNLVAEIDFEAVFEHDAIYSEIPLDPVADRVRDFVIELDEQNLQQFDSDVIGRIYEGVIPAERRHAMGEYYTPPAICDLITQLTIDDAHDDVLDPACGSGGFLVSAYHRKRDLIAESAGAHDQILAEVFGIDVNRFPAHLSAINLAIQDLSSYTDHVNIEVADFFDVEPDTQRFSQERASASGSDEHLLEGSALGGLDAIVANPPYIKSRNIDSDHKDKARGHLDRLDAGDMTRRMDIYGYFLTHSTEFLADGGRLGFLTNDTWLDTGYGSELQEFILEHYRIDAIIKLDRQAFDDALVGSSILLLTREEDEQARDHNVAKFVRVSGSIDIDDIVDVVEEELEADRMMRDEQFRVVTREQAVLYEEDKWTTYFRAPPIYYDIHGHDRTEQLDDVADVNFGIKTGANAFFYGRREEWEELGLGEYTTPLLKASGQVNRIRFTEEDAREWGVLDLDDLVQTPLEEARSVYEDVDEEDFVKEWLVDEGHDTLVEYIESGEESGYHSRPSTEHRTLWFNLGELTYPPMFIPDFTWRVHRVVWSEVRAVSDRQFYTIEPNAGVDSELLCGILNSRVVWLMCELRGRWSQGQEMSRSEIKVYEAEELPVPELDGISGEERDEIVEAFHVLMEQEDELNDEDRTVENTEEERDRLDRTVLSAMGMEDQFNELKEAIHLMLAMREREGGQHTQVLVSRPTEREIIELEGVEAARESTTLGDF
jgi:type I restriction-modification system DNA methylase subunit